MDGNTTEEIERLKGQIEQIRTQFHLLLSNQDQASIKYIREIDQVTEERQVDADKFRLNEEKAAHMLYNGFVYQMHDVIEDAKETITERSKEFFRIELKTQIIDNFPKASKYFLSKNCQFFESIELDKLLEQIDKSNEFSVELSTKPIVDDFKTNTFRKEKTFSVKNGILYRGSSELTLGSNALLTFLTNGDYSIPCRIKDINSQYIELSLNDNVTKKLKIEALNNNICDLQKL